VHLDTLLSPDGPTTPRIAVIAAPLGIKRIAANYANIMSLGGQMLRELTTVKPDARHLGRVVQADQQDPHCSDGILAKPRIGAFHPVAQFNCRSPSEGTQLVCRHKLARRPVRLGSVISQLAL